MEIKETKNVYFVGKFYDPDLEGAPSNDSKYDLIIYVSPEEENSRRISSLEGIFVSDKKTRKIL